jgi:hypothetical protein
MQWSPRYVVIPVVSIVFALLRRYAPAPKSKFASFNYEQRQIPKPLPTGVIGAFMWTIGICLLLTFFAFKAANHYWAAMDRDTVLHLYPTAVLWCFFPGFAALSIPWPFTVWLLRRMGRTDEADAIEEDSNQKAGINSFVVMKWLSFGLVAPIGILTVLAIPMHLSIGNHEARLGRYASIVENVFPLDQAKKATYVDGIRYRDGSFHPQKDLLVDFQDGRRLRANAVGDGGTDADPRAIKLLLDGTGLQPQHVSTADDIQNQ